MKTKPLVITALCIALGIVLPIAMHSVPNAGRVFLPMHLPILLCGLLVGWPYGLICGILTPLLSSVLTGMPPAPMLPSMLCELAVYGLAAGLLYQLLGKQKPVVRLYGALIGAMLAGRLVMGVVQALIFSVGQYSMQVWVTSAFVTALPGIAIELVLIPLLVMGLRRAKVV